MEKFSVVGKEFRCRGRLVKVCELAAPWYEEVEDPEAVVAALREYYKGFDLFTFFQRVPDVEPIYNYHMERFPVATLSLSSYDDWWSRIIKKRTRYLVKKAEREGIEIRLSELNDDLIRGISAIFNETPIRQGKKFPHYGDDLDKVRREAGTYPERTVFIAAYFDSEMVGFARIVFEKHFADVLQLLCRISHRDKGVANALMAMIVKVCSEQQAGYLAYGNWDPGGLLDFKRHNGFTRMELPKYFIPLSWRGALALRLGLHRSLRSLVPPGVVRWLLGLRRTGLELIVHRKL